MEPTFGDRLSRWLIFKGIRPAGLARALGVSRTATFNWVNGVVQPDIDRLGKIADILQISLADFFGPLPDLHTAATPALSTVEPELGPHPTTGEITRDFGPDGIERMLSRRGPCPNCGHSDEAA